MCQGGSRVLLTERPMWSAARRASDTRPATWLKPPPEAAPAGQPTRSLQANGLQAARRVQPRLPVPAVGPAPSSGTGRPPACPELRRLSSKAALPVRQALSVESALARKRTQRDARLFEAAFTLDTTSRPQLAMLASRTSLRVYRSKAGAASPSVVRERTAGGLAGPKAAPQPNG